jgi:dUTP pyrophosphatase
MKTPEIEIPITLDAAAELPTYETEGSAGMDIRIIEDVELQPGERKLAKTGLKAAIPLGYEGQVRPRSGLALKKGITMANSPGTIDSDYRGEIGLILINHSSEVVKLASGERAGQLVICPIARADWKVMNSLEETDRGEGGFGSTGTS